MKKKYKVSNEQHTHYLVFVSPAKQKRVVVGGLGITVCRVFAFRSFSQERLVGCLVVLDLTSL